MAGTYIDVGRSKICLEEGKKGCLFWRPSDRVLSLHVSRLGERAGFLVDGPNFSLGESFQGDPGFKSGSETHNCKCDPDDADYQTIEIILFYRYRSCMDLEIRGLRRGGGARGVAAGGLLDQG